MQNFTNGLLGLFLIVCIVGTLSVKLTMFFASMDLGNVEQAYFDNQNTTPMQIRLKVDNDNLAPSLLPTSKKITDEHFHENEASFKHCSDPKKLMPLCERCIPGLTMKQNASACELSSETQELRRTLVHTAASMGTDDLCNVRKNLGIETIFKHHQLAGKYLDKIRPNRILDIGPYNKPIQSFMEYCPDTVFMIEPCGELAHDGYTPYSSKEISCNNNSKNSIQHVLPMSIKSFIKENPHMQHFTAVVCMECDVTWRELMTMPRPLHLILECSTMAFQKEYPVEGKDGCTVVDKQDFDFSDCPDCSFKDSRYGGHYAKSRKFVIFECNENVQNTISRAAEAKSTLSRFCKEAQDKTYLGMACLGEKILFTSPTINDTSLMALDALQFTEEKSKDQLNNMFKKGKKYDHNRGPCSGKCSGKCWVDGHTWWNTSKDTAKLEKAKSYLFQAKNRANLYEALCFANSARSLLSAAEPQEEIISLLYQSISIYQSLFKDAIYNEKPLAGQDYDFSGYNYLLKRCPPFLDQEYINEVAELEPIFPSGRNFDYREFGQLISFNAYRPLVSFESVKQRIYRKKILIDAGANAFATSPKQLVDNYAALGMQFDELVMFDPNVKGEQKIPYIYKNKMKIIFHKKYVELGTRNVETDLISWIAKNVQKDDFLVLKLDMDEKTSGPTIEWAFLGDLIYSE